MAVLLALAFAPSLCLAQAGAAPGTDTQTASGASPSPALQAADPAAAPSAIPVAPRPVARSERHAKHTSPEAKDAPASDPLKGPQTADAVRITLVLTLLTLIPVVVICMTPFVRIVVVLSMIRHAFGMPETPPNQVLVILALFLTSFVMMPSLARINDEALQPFLKGSIPVEQALKAGAQPLREFMLRQVHDKDLATIYEIAKQPLPNSAAEVGTMQLTSAFMLNELRVSFKIGFVVMLPFLLIDLVVSSILLSLGMIMVPPTTLSLPIKILMFVLIDGWSLVIQGLVGSFH